MAQSASGASVNATDGSLILEETTDLASNLDTVLSPAKKQRPIKAP
jgi:hypothetical protein